MLSQITLVYNLQSQYIFNDLPRKLQSEFMEKIYVNIEGQVKSIDKSVLKTWKSKLPEIINALLIGLSSTILHYVFLISYFKFQDKVVVLNFL